MLALDPTVMLLDEPTAGMGREDVDRTIDLVRRIAEGRTVVFVDHNMDQLASSGFEGIGIITGSVFIIVVLLFRRGVWGTLQALIARRTGRTDEGAARTDADGDVAIGAADGEQSSR